MSYYYDHDSLARAILKEKARMDKEAHEQAVIDAIAGGAAAIFMMIFMGIMVAGIALGLAAALIGCIGDVWRSYRIITFVDRQLIFWLVLTIAVTLAGLVSARRYGFLTLFVYLVLMLLLQLPYTGYVHQVDHLSTLCFIWFNFWRTAVVASPFASIIYLLAKSSEEF